MSFHHQINMKKKAVRYVPQPFDTLLQVYVVTKRKGITTYVVYIVPVSLGFKKSWPKCNIVTSYSFRSCHSFVRKTSTFFHSYLKVVTLMVFSYP